MTYSFAQHFQTISGRKRALSTGIVLLVALFLQSCSPSLRFSALPQRGQIHLPTHIASTEPDSPAPHVGTVIEGYASYYGDEFQGRATSSGEIFDQSLMTAAHRSLPFGTIVRITNTRNGRSVLVKVNDRGPFVDGRVIDLSRAAAEKLDMLREGVAHISLSIIN